MLKLIRVAALVTLVCIPTVGAADDTPDGGEHHGPRPQAIAACKDKSEGDACTFEGHHGTVSGTCRKAKTGDLACRRSDHHHEGSGN